MNYAEDYMQSKMRLYRLLSIKGATIYTTHFPCSVCMKMLVNAEIKEIVYLNDYPDDLAKEILKESNIKVRKLEG